MGGHSPNIPPPWVSYGAMALPPVLTPFPGDPCILREDRPGGWGGGERVQMHFTGK